MFLICSYLDLKMAPMMILLVSFDDSQREDLKLLKSNLQEFLRADNIDVHLLVDVHHMFQKLPKYSSKLEKMLEKVKVTFIITSISLCSIKDKAQLEQTLKKIQYFDDTSSKIFMKFIEKSKSRLALLSLQDGMEPPAILKQVHHLTGMLEKDAESNARWIAGRCKGQ